MDPNFFLYPKLLKKFKLKFYIKPSTSLVADAKILMLINIQTLVIKIGKLLQWKAKLVWKIIVKKPIVALIVLEIIKA